MEFPIKQIAINQLKQHTEQQDHQSFHNYPIKPISSFTSISGQGNEEPRHARQVGSQASALPKAPFIQNKRKGPNLTGTGYSDIFRYSIISSLQTTSSRTPQTPSKLSPTVEDVLLEVSAAGNYFHAFEHTEEPDLANFIFDFDLGFGMVADVPVGDVRMDD